MHHFFVDPSAVREGTLVLEGAEAHHAGRVLRVRPGERISVADGTGRVVDAVVTKVGRAIDAEIRSVRESEVRRPLLTLYQGVAKGDRMEIAVQKAVEIGVRRIVPVLTERSVVRWDERRRLRARERWSEIARAAAKQCRSPWLTSIDEVRDGVKDMTLDEELRIVLHVESGDRLRDVLPTVTPASVALVVGPEGGLTDAEVDALVARGARTATLGERTLRTETAGTIASALVLYSYGSLG